MTELAPDRAQQILYRGRAYGDSRFICGAHNESAVEAGVTGAGTVQTVPDIALLDIYLRGEGPTPDVATTDVAAKQKAVTRGWLGY